MMDRVQIDRWMLLVNNSPRCHLQSLFPAHFSLSGRFSLDSDWRNRGKDITCYANATGYFVASLPDSFLINLYTFFFLHNLPVFSICLNLYDEEGNKRVLKLSAFPRLFLFSLLLALFIITITLSFLLSQLRLFPFLCILLIPRQGEVKNIVSIQTSTCRKRK